MADERIVTQTLDGLSSKELDRFVSLLELEEGFPQTLKRRLEVTNRTDVVDLIMEAYGQSEWVEVTRRILEKIKGSEVVQRLSEVSSGIKETEQCTTLMQRIETLTSVIELLMETINDLTAGERMFLYDQLWKQIYSEGDQYSEDGSRMQHMTDMEDNVFLVVKTFGQQAVKMIMEVLKTIERNDLLQRLSDKSSTSKKTHTDDKSLSGLIHKVATIAAVRELLLETLYMLNHIELEKFKWFLQFICFQRSFPLFLQSQLGNKYRPQIVNMIMEKYGQQSVEVIMDVLMDMNKTDLVQNLIETSAELKGVIESSTETFNFKTTNKEHWPALTQTVETLTSVIEQMLETLADFDSEEIKQFKEKLPKDVFRYKHDKFWWLRDITDVQDCVFFMVETYGQKSVEKTREILEKMKKMEFVQRLRDTSSGSQEKTPEDKNPPTLIHKVATMAAVKQMLLETLNDLSDEEHRLFKEFLEMSPYQKDVMHMSWRQLTDRGKVVDLLLDVYGQQCVEETKKILIIINKTDLVERFSGTRSGLKEKHLVSGPGIEYLTTVPPTDDKKILLETLDPLTNKEFKTFKWSLQFMYFVKGIPQMLRGQKEQVNKKDLVKMMVERHGEQSVEVMREIFNDMNRPDLLERLSKIREKHWKKEQQLNVKVEKLANITKLLLDVRADLKARELENFKQIVRSQVLHLKTWLPMMADVQQMVFVMVYTYGQQSVEKTKEILKEVKRDDLVRKISRASSRSPKKYHVHLNLQVLIFKVATVRAVRELLLETLQGLSHKELKKFKWLLQLMYSVKGLHHTQWTRLQRADAAEMVDLMVEESGQQSLKVTQEVFMDMQRTDLVEKLEMIMSELREQESSTKSFPKQTPEKSWYPIKQPLSSDEQQLSSALIQKVESMTTVTELLLETLADLSDVEVKDFKLVLLDQIHSNKLLSLNKWKPLEISDVQDAVYFMVDFYGQKCVDVTKSLLNKINRTDLVQKLTHSSSGPKNAASRSALIHKVATMAAVKHWLSETVSSLSPEELTTFKKFLGSTGSQFDLTPLSFLLTQTEDSKDVVDVMVQTYGQKSVEVTKTIFMDMNRTDLLQRLSEAGSVKAAVEQHRRAKLKKDEAAQESVENILVMLKPLSKMELEKFKWLLQFTYFEWNLSQIPQNQLELADGTTKLVDLMVERHGQESVEVTKEVLLDMNRPDLLDLFLKTYGFQEKRFSPASDDHYLEFAKEKQRQKLHGLNSMMFKNFKRLLQDEINTNCTRISRHRLEKANRSGIVDLMIWTYGRQFEMMTGMFLKKIKSKDQVQNTLRTRTKFKGPTRSLEYGSYGGSQVCPLQQDSSSWTKLKPKLNRTDADKDPVYSLQSEAGTFECSVSGLRWSCKEKVVFRFQFCCWWQHMERMENLHYEPAGPLMDITVDAGKLEHVFLPHWICIDTSTILNKFAVLHVNDCGDDVEKVSEVTSSHVKLPEPVFSPRGALIKAGLPLKIYCNVLIYKINTAFLTLHVYLIPRAPGLLQVVEKRYSPSKCEEIWKPHPEKSLKMRDRFILTTDLDLAEINPPVRFEQPLDLLNDLLWE